MAIRLMVRTTRLYRVNIGSSPVLPTMKKIIFTLLLLLQSIVTNQRTLAFDFEFLPNYDLLYQVMWNEARGEDTVNLIRVLDVIRNRVNHPHYPKHLDSVLLQSYQFCVIKSNPTKSFKNLINHLLTKPIQYPYLYFINPKKAKKHKWIRKKKWIKYENHSFAI